MTVSPTFPQAVAFNPPRFNIAATISTVVVLPLVPVRASHFCPGAISLFICQAKSTSLSRGKPAFIAPATKGWAWRQPGETTTESKSLITTLLASITRCSDLAAGFSSVMLTTAPLFISERATAFPVTPAPRMRILWPSKESDMVIT